MILLLQIEGVSVELLKQGLLGVLLVLAIIAIRFLYLKVDEKNVEIKVILMDFHAKQNESDEKYVASISAMKETIMNDSITTKGYLEKHISLEHKEIVREVKDYIKEMKDGS